MSSANQPSTVNNISKACPECGQTFSGAGWEGIDAHWKSQHEHIMPYNKAWPLISTGGYRRSSAPPALLDINQIMAILPHRYPFLLIDRVIEIQRKQRIVAIKCVTMNEQFFQGHFPGYPIMPGVLMVEAIAQAGGALLLTEVPDRDGKLMVFTGIERAKFRRPVVPGDQVRIEVDVLQWRPRAVKLEGKALVGGKLVCEATITCQLVPRRHGGTGQEAAAQQPQDPETVPAE